MKFGVIYPQTEFGSDPAAIKDYAQTAENLGYSFISAFDHILGVNPVRPGGWQGQYTFQTTFLEPFVLFSFMASITQKIGFTTGVLIMPQRQTALVAKQAATLDVLSGGRLRLGVGLGWNAVEYTCLNENFHNRGRRIEEQVQLMRQLWTSPLVTFSGRWHNIPDAGINPVPLQRLIPIWFGGRAERALRRAARLGDGWILTYRTPEEAAPHVDLLARYLEEAGRGWNNFGLDVRIQYGDGDTHVWGKNIQGWLARGATYASVNTMGSGFSGPEDHIKAIRRFAMEMGIHEQE
jgi:probable F420-dependent oxidoreductase